MNNKFIKPIGAVVVSILMLSSLTGCSHKPTRKGADSFLTQIAPTEKCEVVDLSGDHDEIKVTYSSKERDLVFHVNGIKGIKTATTSSSFEDIIYPKYTSDYVEQVHNIYMDEITDSLDEIGAYEKKYVSFPLHPEYYYDFNNDTDFDTLADEIYEIDQIYAAELEYNDEEWMTKNLILTIMVRSESDYKNHVTIRINGLNSLEDIKDSLDDLDI